MAKYRKKPIVIEAEEYRQGLEDRIEMVAVPDAPPSLVRMWYGDVADDATATVQLPVIDTLEGAHYISPGDYIVTGVEGERYPVKAHIFAATYERVEE